MDTRREFLKKAGMLAGATAASPFIPESIQRALAIQAAPGTTFLDAEHIVFLMQENRSFDHSLGALKGVRGFNDPRILKSEGIPIWYQKNNEGRYFTPFHLDIEKTKATWMGSLPHGWADMVEARNNGKMNYWLEAKKAGNASYKHMPLTLGYYGRQDLPFYYAFADAFTVCDQHFCSSLTGTSPNRSYFWTGTVRENPKDGNSKAHLENHHMVHKDLGWTTFPERLQAAGIPWKVYQNEIGLNVGMTQQEVDWLGNFRDNNLEFHKQYHIKCHPNYQRYAKSKVAELEKIVANNKAQSKETDTKLLTYLQELRGDLVNFSEDKFNALSQQEQEIHRRAFTTNVNDPDYHQLKTIEFMEDGVQRKVQVPKGDLFYQFRKDVDNNELPMVSWLVAPSRFSDHPGAPWFGAWYVSETLDILTKNPEVWKKTIFVLTYDENDGYYDHIPPFVPALHTRPETGAVPSGMRTDNEFVTKQQEQIRSGKPESRIDSPIGLGYRVPLVVASPWSKGGFVNSEVFDLTSSIQFVEYFIDKKLGKDVKETNISDWRRLVCGNMTSIFRKAEDNTRPAIDFVLRDQHVERIYKAREQALPSGFQEASNDTLNRLRKAPLSSLGFHLAEKGTKPACAIPYDIDVNLKLDSEKARIQLIFEIAGDLASTKEIGVPFIVKCPIAYGDSREIDRVWNFAVRPKEKIIYNWPIKDFVGDLFSLEVHGPNGFFRLFQAAKNSVIPVVRFNAHSLHQRVEFEFAKEAKDYRVKDAYEELGTRLKTKKGRSFIWDITKSSNWYDLEIYDLQDQHILFKYAGHQENGQSSISDPLMGGLIQV